MKRVVTVQDISCIGKCSLTVALPVISAMGVETAVIPTAVLSTHTMFKDFTYKDLTSEINPIIEHWEKENISFDAVYTGYLGSFKQIDIVSDMFDRFKTDSCIIFVDPVMADNGRFYTGFDEAFAEKMAGLCAKADVIVPNITEASFMTGIEYRQDYDEDYVKNMLLKLSEFGARYSVLTGIGFAEGYTGVMGYDSMKGEFYYYSHKKCERSYHGTGDIFSSTCVGAMMNGLDWKESLKLAADYTAECIRLSIADKNGRAYGVNFEEAIPYLTDRLRISKNI